MPFTWPYPTFTPGAKADANQLTANNSALAAKLNGGIVDADLSAGAAIDGNKLSQASGKQVPTAALATNAVDNRVLASDSASPGSDASRAVSGANIRALVAADLARILPAAAILAGHLKVTTYSHGSAITLASGASSIVSTGITAAGTVPLAFYVARATASLIVLTLKLDAGLWKFEAVNFTVGAATINAGELKLLYVAAS